MMQRMMLMKSAKLSARTTPKLRASVSHRKHRRDERADEADQAEAGDAASARPGWRIASASMAAIADSTTLTHRDDGDVVDSASALASAFRNRPARRSVAARSWAWPIGSTRAPARTRRHARRRRVPRLHRPQEERRARRPCTIAMADRRNHQRPLARREIRERSVLLVRHRPVVDALEHPEHVDRRAG